MRFDYYSATLPAQISHSKEKIKEAFHGRWDEENPVRPYKFGLRLSSNHSRLYWGGQNPLPFFVVSGEETEKAAQFIRQTYKDHRVSRADVCEDFDIPGGFDHIKALIEPIARSANVEVCFMGDPDPAKKTGRTMYYGSAKSDVRICLYEKGLHQRLSGNELASEDWVRLELRVRPRKQRKALSASLSASQMWGLSKWSSKVAETVLGSIVPFTPDPSLRRSKTDQAISHMLKQYASVIRRYVDDHSEEDFMKQIKEVLQDA